MAHLAQSLFLSLSAALGLLRPLATLQTTIPETPTGSVSGYVYCADTNAPARFANVVLEPESVIRASGVDWPPRDPAPTDRGDTTTAIYAALDGSFRFEGVKPGRYYLIANLPGYINPLSQVAQGDLERPTPELKDMIATLLEPVVVVTANHTTAASLRLIRGATLSGTVTYDDGNPAIDANLHLLVRQRNSKWGEANLVLTGLRQWPSLAIRTDDRGRFRISGLAPGTYALDVSISTTVMTFSKLQLGGASLQSSTHTGQTLHIYSGNRLIQKDAAPIVITAGEDRADAGIVIPLSHLHTVSGTLTAKRDGHALNQGRAILLYRADKSEVQDDWVEADGSFSFSFIPEGEYLLQIRHAADTELREGRSSDGTSVVLPVPVHSYSEFEQPLSVPGDLTGVLAPAPERLATSAANAW
jgi:hypothetical protein